MSDLETLIRTANAIKEDAIEITAESALSAVKAAGVLSIMPAPHLPLTGLLLFVHPDVYDRIRDKQSVERRP